MRKLVVAAVIAAAVLGAGLTKIADLDFWWQLKNGQLIAGTHEIPRTEIYSYTEFGRPYVDHEWGFQLSQWAAYAPFGPAGVALLKCLLFGATLILIALYVIDRGVDPVLATGFAFLAIAGGVTRFIERPELFSTLFSAVTFICCDSYLRTRNWRWLAVLPPLYVVWANIHAAVIVGLAIQFFFIRSRKQVLALAGSAAASLINPFGYRVLTVAFELTRIIDSGVINNEEWRHPTLQKVPLYFVALLITVVLLIRSRNLGHMLVAAFLAFISLRYIRNVGLFCVFVPLVVYEPAARLDRAWRYAITAVATAGLAFILVFYFPFERGFGEAWYFPKRLVQTIRARNLRGHMLNAYSFAGYLIWNLYPERRVFIDSRNEIYLPLLARVKAARANSRAWSALLRDYSIEYAVVDYVDDLERVVTFDKSGKPVTMFAPTTATRFPRSSWALVDWDDTGMLFVKRGGVNSTAGEYTSVFPEGSGYERELVRSGQVDRMRAIAELQRKLSEDPASKRARQLMRDVQNR